MNQRERQARKEPKSACSGANRRKTWHPRPTVKAGTRVAGLLKRQASRTWMPALSPAILSAILLAIWPQFGLAQADMTTDITPGQMQSGSLLLRMKSGYVVATRMNTDIEATVSGLVARVSVRQSFQNDGQEWVEGIYVFPLPDTAAVDRLRMHIGERFIEGEIREKGEAKKEYEAAKKAGKKTSLIQQQRANLFTTSVANIGPGETITVEIEYLETLAYDEGSFSLRFPLTLTPRYIPGTPLPGRKGSGWALDTTSVPDASLITPPVVTRSRDHKINFTATIDAGVPLELIASRYHPIDVSDESGRYLIELTDASVPLDHDLELTWRPVVDSAPRATVFSESRDGQPYLLIMLLPPNDLSAPTAEFARELVFIIDTSGSMHGTSLSQATRALTLALDGLHPTDRFNVIQFNSVTSTLFRSSVDATVSNIGIAKRYVAGLEANGGTEMRPAITRALEQPGFESHLRQVIFITDGSVGNEQELFSLIERELGTTRLFTVGIGSAPNSWFMRKAAEAGRGTFTLISALHEVNEKMDRLFRKLEQPQITDITVQWPAGTRTESYPETIPDLYVGEPIVIKALLDNELKQGDLLKISGNSALGTWGAELLVEQSDASPGVAAIWARARIENLMDRKRQGAAHEEIRKAVIDTALSHHLVSKYTSLVAVDKTPVRPAYSKLSKEQVPNLLPYGQSMNAIFGFPATATNAGAYRMNGALLVATALLLLLILMNGRRRHAAPVRN
jgi:Ca-activated chloride channel family protein